MEIIKKSREDITNKELYFLINSPEIKKASDLRGKTVDLLDWVLYKDKNNNTDEDMELLSLKTPEGVYATNSPTMIREFDKIVACFGTDFHKIKIYEQKSAKGRSYTLCTFVE